ncbi:MAG: hypothetical protein JSW25_04145, partial [Thermoplasmata archaeon]
MISMAISRAPVRPIALLVALMFLLAPLSPLVGAAPGDAGDDPLGPGDGWFTALDEDDTIPIVSVLEGPTDDPFAASLTNLGDVDGDGIDDMIVGSGYDWWLEDDFAPWGGGGKQYLLRGKEDRNYTVDDLEEIGNGSIGWNYHSERWIGDVNDDGHADLVYRLNDLKVRANGEIWWEDQYKLFVHYGSEDGFGEEPDTNFTIMPDGLEPNNTYFTFQFGGVG